MKFNIVTFFVLLFIILSCGNQNSSPKPEGYVRLEYPKPDYKNFETECPFTFQFNTLATIEKDSACWYVIDYKPLKGKLYLSYFDVTPSTLPNYIKQSEKLVFEHTIKASGIDPKMYVNKDAKVYGTFYELMGESATNFQFYLTDSTSHFLQGSFYFRAQPKPDSLQPAVDYIKEDLIEIINSAKWK